MTISIVIYIISILLYIVVARSAVKHDTDFSRQVVTSNPLITFIMALIPVVNMFIVLIAGVELLLEAEIEIVSINRLFGIKKYE